MSNKKLPKETKRIFTEMVKAAFKGKPKAKVKKVVKKIKEE